MDARTRQEERFIELGLRLGWTDKEFRQEWRAAFGTEYTGTYKSGDTRTASAGTPEKVELMRERCLAGLRIFQPHDAWLNEHDREVMEADRQSNGRDVNRRVHAYSWEDEESEDLLDCDPCITERLGRVDGLLDKVKATTYERTEADAD